MTGSTAPEANGSLELAPSGNGSVTGSETVGVDKIRDLLFGNQMQDYDRRFSKLEERFLQRFKDIESETATLKGISLLRFIFVTRNGHPRIWNKIPCVSAADVAGTGEETLGTPPVIQPGDQF